MTFDDDLCAEGAPEPEFNPGIAERIPKKRVAGGALIRDHAERILFVTPGYKPFLEIPGGVAESNESPLAACRREVREEIGLDLAISKLLVVDWMPAHGVWTDGVMFIFDGGQLNESQSATLKIEDPELTGFRFLTLEESTPFLRPSMVRRIASALAALNDGSPRYAEFGRT
ncbi:NUDIX domain-containing protein [Micromonospora inyonensis]|uniref:NUDIX domain-containing protein n=1 Tax=Micromonospora inyonensis TaxID=47866 RepID=A0A1C6RL56_9ACTN|nr:NUDIX hydrolase [Micromonospora inyonensis]SCL17912.1 NUDIX domain-containing protein [Micromonospora inyonensis]